jgi:alpha-mannosidase
MIKIIDGLIFLLFLLVLFIEFTGGIKLKFWDLKLSLTHLQNPLIAICTLWILKQVIKWNLIPFVKRRRKYFAALFIFFLSTIFLSQLYLFFFPKLVVLKIEATDLLGGPKKNPQPVIRVKLFNPGIRKITATRVSIGEIKTEESTMAIHQEIPFAKTRVIETRLELTKRQRKAREINTTLYIQHTSGSQEEDITLTLPKIETGWKIFIVPGFHYDPVWWNTQNNSTRKALRLINTFLEVAQSQPEFKFVLEQIPYLKPFWDEYPMARTTLQELIQQGRCEIVGGTYNQLQSTMVSPETIIRSILYGLFYQEEVMRAEVDTSWQCDVFGHDPNFPQFMKKAGVSYAAWFRGPFHDWGITSEQINFPTEFLWMAPDGNTLLTHYMSAGYHAGAKISQAKNLSEAGRILEGIFSEMKKISLTRNILLPMGDDFAEPFLNLTQLARWWNNRYLSPKVIIATPREFFHQLQRDISIKEIPVITRDMGPIFSGTSGTNIDSKLAQRKAENTLLTAERFATLAYLLGTPYPSEILNLAWRQLLFNAHHDAITGTESDQVYLDLTFGWREAYELAQKVLDNSLQELGEAIHTEGLEGNPLVVFNPLSWVRDDVVTFDLKFPFRQKKVRGIKIMDLKGREVPYQVEDYIIREDGSIEWLKVSFIGRQIPALGYRVYQIIPLAEKDLTLPQEEYIPPNAPLITLQNRYYQIVVDPTQGGGITSLKDKRNQKEFISRVNNALGNELVFYEEYAGKGDGRWVFYPTGKKWYGRNYQLRGQLKQGPVSTKLILKGNFKGCLRQQEIILYHDLERIDFSITLIDIPPQQGIYKVHFPVQLKGAKPIFQVANAVIGRSFGYEINSQEQRYTLDSPAYQWAEYGINVPLIVKDFDTEKMITSCSLGVGEIIKPKDKNGTTIANLLATGLIKKGITTTQTLDTNRRYGDLKYDSNLPDFRISLGNEKINRYTALILKRATPEERSLYHRILEEKDRVFFWLKLTKDLPVLIISEKKNSLSPLTIHKILKSLEQKGQIVAYGLSSRPQVIKSVEDYGIALINKGTLGYNIYPDGILTMTLIRNYQGWPAGVWISGPKRTLPDGSSLQSMRGTYTFEYCLYPHKGYWYQAQTQQRAYEFNFPLIARTFNRHQGILPLEMSFIAVPSKQVILTALKLKENYQLERPIFASPEKRSSEILLRIYETTGRPASAKITFFKPIQKAWRADLREKKQKRLIPKHKTLAINLSPFSTETIILQTSGPEMLTTDPKNPYDTTESFDFLKFNTSQEAKPIYYKYWELNRGAAPFYLGKPLLNTPPYPLRDKWDKTRIDLTGFWKLIKIDQKDGIESAVYEIKIPGSWDAQGVWHGGIGRYYKNFVPPPDWKGQELSLILEANNYRNMEVFINDHPLVPEKERGARKRIYHIPRNLVNYGHDNQLVIEINDTKYKGVIIEQCYLRIGREEISKVLYSVSPKVLTLPPGKRKPFLLTLTNPLPANQWYEIQVISPINTWDLITPYSQLVSLMSKETKKINFYLNSSKEKPPGHYWFIIKILGTNQIHYTDPIEIVIP